MNAAEQERGSNQRFGQGRRSGTDGADERQRPDGEHRSGAIVTVCENQRGKNWPHPSKRQQCFF
jgi:hypothetical protein